MHDLVSEPPVEHAEEALGYAQRDPRAGQGIAEHKVGLTFLAAAETGKCCRVAFTLREIADLIRTDMTVGGLQMTSVTLSERDDFTGFAISHRGGVFGIDAAIETLEHWGVRGIVYAPPGEDGWRALIPLSCARRRVEEHRNKNGKLTDVVKVQNLAAQDPRHVCRQA